MISGQDFPDCLLILGSQLIGRRIRFGGSIDRIKVSGPSVEDLLYMIDEQGRKTSTRFYTVKPKQDLYIAKNFSCISWLTLNIKHQTYLK